MDNLFCLDKNFSTTKFLTKIKPTLEYNSDFKLKPKLFIDTALEQGGLRTKGYFKQSYENKPLISIVTVVYNGEKYLEQTIKSVIEQTYDNIEYIIVDGNSNDKTLEIIKRYEDKIDYWISEPDNGVYNAMNKGLSLVTGDYVSFLNADDWYMQNTLKIVVVKILQEKCGYIFGDMNLIDNKGEIVDIRKSDLSIYRVRTPIGHQALFVQAKYLFQMPFNIKHKIFADYDFMIKLIKNDISFCQIDKVIVNFRIGGISSSESLGVYRFFVHLEHFGFFRAFFDYLLMKNNKVLSLFLLGILDLKNKIYRTR